ncbi:MAG: sulfotransferase family 2 domain-containing protein [Rhodothermales bacterium]
MPAENDTIRWIIRGAKNWARSVRNRYFYDFVFIHINKTAGSSIERALGLRFEHKTALEKRAELGPARWDKRFSFTFVRNPWDRVVSLYHYRIMTNTTGLGDKPIDFKTWVRLTFRDHDPDYYNSPKMLMPQWDWIVDREGNILVDFVGRFENLEYDFRAVCHRVHRQATLPHLKKTTRSPYRAYYDDASIEIVQDWFKVDVEEFDYEF